LRANARPHITTSETTSPASTRKIFFLFALDGFYIPHHDNFHHATTCKHKVSSLCSTGNLFALLNKDESRGKFTVSIHECHFPRADAGAHAGGGG